MFVQMTIIETKQNELDAKFTSMLDNQQAQIQTLIDMKIVFSEFLGTQKDHIKLVLFLEPKLAFD
jgi:hypothetical protein